MTSHGQDVQPGLIMAPADPQSGEGEEDFGALSQLDHWLLPFLHLCGLNDSALGKCERILLGGTLHQYGRNACK